ncbi:MAG: hypothetical protein MUC66_02575 [Methanolinea sp.]|jgi:hypothetical protein|nr:hypothetical protein [Methanolinea sp.]
MTTKGSATLLCLIVLISSLFVQGALAVAPDDAPILVNTPPSGDIPPSTTGTANTPVHGVAFSLPLPIWTILGIVLIATAAAGFLLLQRPKVYEPRSKRLQK